MMDTDWHELEKIARSLRESGLNATPGQIAGQLLHDSIARLETSPVAYRLPEEAPNPRVSEGPRSTYKVSASPGSNGETTYLIGAGINRGVFGSARPQLPLAREFFRYALGRPGLSPDTDRGARLRPLWQFIERYWHIDEEALRKKDFDLEECFTLIELQYIEALASQDATRLQDTSALWSLLAGLLGECFAHHELWPYFSPEYQALGRLIYDERATVLTFNYDTLLEAAVEQGSPSTGIDIRSDMYSLRAWNRLLAYKVHFDEVVCRPGLPDPVGGEEYYAPFGARETEHPPFLKLHGSVDWHFRSGHTLGGVNIGPAGAIDRSQRSRFHRSAARFDGIEIDHGTAEIFLRLMITPVLNKPVHEHAVFRKVWQEASNALKRTKSLVVAGYSFPPTDFHVRRLLREAFAENELEQLCVVNPDTSVVSLARDLCNFRKPVFVCRDIGEYLRRTISPEPLGIPAS